MPRSVTIAGVFMCFALYSSSALSGIYTDDLSRCLVSSTSAQDKTMLVQWIFSMLTLNAAVAPLSTVTPEQRDGFNQKAGDLSQRLMLVDCRKQTVEAIKYEGVGAIQASFEV